MSVSKLFRVLLGLCLTFGLIAQSGCFEGLDPLDNPPTDNSTPADNTGNNTENEQQTNPPASAQTPVVSITSLLDDITVAQGQPILLTWQIQNLPAQPTIDVLYRATNEQNNKTLIGNLTTSSVGSLQIDTYNFIPGLTYVITVQLKSASQAVASDRASGLVTIASPTLTITAPRRDANLLPSSTLNVTWTGKYLPAGAELQTFFDTDTTYNNGNELVLKTDTLPAGSEQASGSITLEGATLWSNVQIVRSNPYYIGLRIVKNGQTTIAGYSSATAKLYGGENFNIVSPASQVELRAGDRLSVRWSTAGVPSSLKVQAFFSDRTTGAEIATGLDYNVSAGGATLLTNNLLANHSYDLVLKLVENDTAVAVKKAAGTVLVTTQGSTIIVSNPEILNTGDKVCLGLENTFNIKWELVQPPVNGVVDLYLDLDGQFETTDDQIKITPEGGLAASLKNFDLTPTSAAFAGKTGQEYFVIARLLADGILFDDDLSLGKIRIGDGGVLFTNPVSDVELQMGNTLNITWTLTGGICAKFPGQQKIIKLYIDTEPAYRAGTSQEITPLAGLDACAVNSFTFDPATLDPPIAAGTGYYIVAKLMVEGNEEDEAHAASPGKFTTPSATITVLTPTIDVKTGFNAINVTWNIEGMNTAGMKVRIVAVDSTDNELPISALIDAATNAGVADASKLPAGTYAIRCNVIGFDAGGSELKKPFATGNARGRIVIANEYNGIYQLSDMAAAGDPLIGYSPIDGTIFEGANIEDSAGYEVVGVGDIGGEIRQRIINAETGAFVIENVPDGFNDFFVFSRYGKIYGNNQAGAGYLIYGKSDFSPILNLNNVASLNPSSRIDGTVVLLPMENAASDLGGGNFAGKFFATPLPDVSGDSKGDLMLSCLEAAPLTITINNADPSEAIDIVINGVTITAPANFSTTALSHVRVQFTVTGPYDADNSAVTTTTLHYGQDYLPGNMITININPVFNPEGTEIVGHEIAVVVDPAVKRLASCYLLTSDRLTQMKYYNSLFDMQFVGDLNNMDDLVGAARDEMLSVTVPDQKFGVSVSPIPDLNNNGSPELFITNKDAMVLDFADLAFPVRNGAGVGMMFDSHRRLGIDFAPMVDSFNDSGLSEQVDFLGKTDNAHLTSVAALGKIGGNGFAGGDFNNDGDFDLVIGSPGENADAGAVYILPLYKYFNYKTPLIDMDDVYQGVEPDLGLQNPIPGIKITGTAGDKLGESVKAIGDFNGDGLADFVIALPDKASSGLVAGAGRVMIVFGKADIPDVSIGIDTIDSSPVGPNGLNALIFEGVNANDHVGTKVCAVYDVNGDGFDDLLIAVPDADDGAKADCGKIYLIYGHRNIITTQGTDTSVDYDGDGNADSVWSIEMIGADLPGAVFVGEKAGDKLQAVTAVGDVNGDGIGDFLIGAPFADNTNGPQDAGKAYLILGRPFTWPTN